MVCKYKITTISSSKIMTNVRIGDDMKRRNIRIENLLQFQELLAIRYKYRKLNKKLSQEVRQKYLDNLPEELNIEGDINFKNIHLI